MRHVHTERPRAAEQAVLVEQTLRQNRRVNGFERNVPCQVFKSQNQLVRQTTKLSLSKKDDAVRLHSVKEAPPRGSLELLPA